MPRLANLVRVLSATSGTGTLTLGSAVQGFLTPSQAGMVDGGTYSYAIEGSYVAAGDEQVASAREVGYGVWTSASNTLTRNVVNSTNGNALVSFTGDQQVIIALVDVGDTIVSGVISPASFSTQQNNYAPTGHATATHWRLTLGANATITGIAGGTPGRIIILHNLSGFTLTLSADDASSTDINRIHPNNTFGTGGNNIYLLQRNMVMLIYDGVLQRWYPILPIFGSLMSASVGSGLSVSADVAGTLNITGGKMSFYVSALEMSSRFTNGPTAGFNEASTNKENIWTFGFDTSTQEFVQFSRQMPKSWDEGTISFVPVWTHGSTTTNFGVVWGMQAVALSNDDAADTAFGTAQTSTDTGGTTSDIYMGPESSAITVGGSPAENDYVVFQVYRDPANGSDTLAIDAQLIGVMVFYTVNAANDA